jgi:hypothetical protein
VKTDKSPLLCVAQIDIAEEAPNGDRDVPNDRPFDLAEPAHKARGQASGNSIRQREVEEILLEHPGHDKSDCHLLSHFFG